MAILAGDADEMIAERAGGALLTQPLNAFLAALARPNAPPALFVHCAENLADKAEIADALAKNPNCPGELLLPAVRHLTTSGVQALMDDLGRLAAAPALAAVLAASPSLTAAQRLELQELQQEANDPAAVEEAVKTAEPNLAKRQTLMQKLMHMGVVERVKLALTGNREERLALIRDRCKVVQRAVLQSQQLTEREVEAFSAMANISDEVLRHIGLRKSFLRNYTIVRNLVSNPKTPLDISLHLLPTINAQDLKMLAQNKNVPDTLRSMAIKLQRQRTLLRERG